MSSAIACTRCGRQLQLPPELLGKPVMCPGCNLIFVPQADGTVSRPSKPVARRPPGPSANPPASPVRPPTFKHKPKRVESLDPDDSDLPMAEIQPSSSVPVRPSPGAWAGPVPPVRRRPPPEPELPMAELMGSAPAPELLSIDPERARPRRPRFRSHRRRGPDLKVPLIIGGSIIALAIVGVVVFFAIQQFGGDGGWQTLSPPGGGFTVLVPPEMPRHPVVMEVDAGGNGFHVHLVELNKEEYLVGYGNVHGRGEADAELLFTGTAQSVLSRMNQMRGPRAGQRATMRDTGALTLDGHPGREYLFQYPGTQAAAFRLYLVNNRLYMLLGNPASSSGTRRLFNSFKLTG